MLKIDFLIIGFMKNSVTELCILHSIGTKGRPTRAPKIAEVLRCSLSFSQIKFNTDDVARDSYGLAGYGGIFRDHMGLSLGCFASHLGLASALEVDLQVVICKRSSLVFVFFFPN